MKPQETLSAKILFENTAQLNPLTLVKQLSKTSTILCDQPIYTFLLSQGVHTENHKLVLYDDGGDGYKGSLLNGRNCIVISLSNEKDILARLRENHSGHSYLGFVNDILICEATNTDPENQDSSRNNPPASHAYAVVCSARSGSTFLCELIGRNLYTQKPLENLRPYIVFLYAHREEINFDFRKWLDLSISASINEGVFSTKVIAQFLWRLAPVITNDDLQYLLEKIEALNLKFIFLERKEKVGQAVSQYIAARTKMWHIKEDADFQLYEQSLETITYDFNLINKQYLGMINSDKRLNKVLGMLQQPVFNITYEDLLDNIESSVTDVIEFIGVKRRNKRTQTVTRVKRTFREKNRELIEMFQSDLKSQK